MRMAGERVIAVEPLVGAGLADAVDLFLLRASESSGIAEWSDAQVMAARRLCAQLDGLPLAIELAASRLDVLTLDELTASLAEPAGATDTGQRGTGRHDSIDAAIEWSVRTTSASERALLSQLVEFSGSFSLEAVAGICTSEDGDVRELTVSLARRSLVSAVGPAVGERRFRMLDTVKRYVKATHPIADREAWQRRHAAWMTEYAERISPLLRTPEARRARQGLVANRPDLDDATSRCIAWGDRATGLRLMAALAWFGYERGGGHEAIATIERVLDLPGEPMPAAEAAVLYPLAYLHSIAGDVVAVVQTIQQFAEAAEAADDPAHAMIAHTLLASLAAYEGGPDAAAPELEIARTYRERLGEDAKWAVADHLYIRGDCLRIAGLPAQALDSLEEAFRLANELGHTWTVASTCYITGKVLTQVGRSRDALGMLRTGAQRAAEREDGTSVVAAVNASAVALVELGDHVRAAELFGVVDAQGPRFGFHPTASDGSYGAPYRERAAGALGAAAWEELAERGRRRDLRWALAQLA
jgi:tetratricopeptide (TPR) repeat protein